MKEQHIYPLLFEPVLKDYIWGGRNLERLYSRDLPPGSIAESWEISGHEDGTTAVTNGYYAGLPLTTVQNALKLNLIGSRNAWAQERGKFPLLIKLLDANRPLSVQVHPDDIYALEHEGNELGKTEMWVVLHAEPEAALILGLRPPASPQLFRQAISDGSLERYLHRLPINAGDAICVPAGTVHAILEGAVIAEIQQNSNTTYRVYDWNRLGVNGEPRPLHVDKAIDVIDFARVEPGLAQPQLVYAKDGLSRFLLCSNTYFTTERVELQDGAVYHGRCDGSTLEIFSARQGISRNTVSTLIRDLESEGLIERHLDNDDRRRFNIRLTQAGRSLVRQNAGRHYHVVAGCFDVLTPDEQENLNRTLSKLGRSITEARESIDRNQ